MAETNQKYVVEILQSDSEGLNTKTIKREEYQNDLEAWKGFLSHKKDLDFFIDWGEDENAVEMILMDESSCMNVLLYKWEGFDSKWETRVEFEGKTYPSLDEFYQTIPDDVDSFFNSDDPSVLFIGEDSAATVYMAYDGVPAV